MGDGLKTISANGNVAVCGADRRQSGTTGLLQEHGVLATAMPRPTMCRRVLHQLLLKQQAARASKIFGIIWKNFHTGRAVAI
jgi:hypothetical protein